MSEFDFRALFEALSRISGISGSETATADFFAARLEKCCDEVKRDRLGNVLGIVRCGKKDAPMLLYDAHLDEIGFLVCEHLPGGFVKLARVGGMDPGVLPSGEVILYGEKTVHAVAASLPPHLVKKESREKKPTLTEIVFDTMLSDEEVKRLLPIGTPGGFADGYTRLLGRRFASRGLDDRSACAVLCAFAEEIDRTKMAADVALLLSVQEEVGALGAKTASFALSPDLCLSVDVSFSDFPGAQGRMLKLGGGPGISYSDTLSRPLTRDVIRAAEEGKIPYQLLGEPGETGTNAHDIQVSAHGIPSAIISLPLAYMHSPSEVMDEADLEETVKLLCAYAGSAAYFPREEVLK